MGYLAAISSLNLAGRPLEFHCTAPIKPNPAQQILYGPTLESFLYGEQSAPRCWGMPRQPPGRLYGSRARCSLRDLVDVPVALVLPPAHCRNLLASRSAGGRRHRLRKLSPPCGARLSAAQPWSTNLITFELGRNGLALSQPKGDDRKWLSERLGEAAASLDLWEPFTRIREAIEEAQQERDERSGPLAHRKGG